MKLAITSIFIGVFAFVLYLVTLAPTFGWGDSADLAMRMVSHSDTTFAVGSRNYQIYFWIGSLFQLLPTGDAGTRANIMSVFFGAVTTGVVAFLTGYLTRNFVAGLAAGISLMVAHTFWFMSVTAEVYTFNTTLIFGCYTLIAAWWRTHHIRYLMIATIVAGIALSHHATGLILAATIFPLIAMRIKSLRLLHIAMLVCIFFVSSSLYLQRTAFLLSLDIPFLYAVGLATPTNLFFDASPVRESIKLTAYAGYNFLGFGFPLAAGGMVIAWQKRMWEMLPPILWLLLIIYAGITSSIPDKFNIYVLAYPVLAIGIGIAVATAKDTFLHTKKRLVLLLLLLGLTPPLGYIATIYTTQLLGVDLVKARIVPYRDNAWYFMWPSKRGDMGARQYATEALAAVEKNTLLIADYTLWRPLYFMQAVENMRPDVNLVWVENLRWRSSVLDYIKTIDCKQSVYLATNTPPEYYQLKDILTQHSLKQVGVVFKVERKCLK